MKIILFFSTCAVALSSPFSMPRDVSDYSVDFNGSDKLISLKVTDEENSLCEFSPGTMFCRGRSNILKEKTKVKSNEECAKLCKEEPSCNHWTRRKKDNFGRCWLKKTDSCTKENDKYDSGINCKGKDDEMDIEISETSNGEESYDDDDDGADENDESLTTEGNDEGSADSEVSDDDGADENDQGLTTEGNNEGSTDSEVSEDDEDLGDDDKTEKGDESTDVEVSDNDEDDNNGMGEDDDEMDDPMEDEAESDSDDSDSEFETNSNKESWAKLNVKVDGKEILINRGSGIEEENWSKVPFAKLNEANEILINVG